MRRKTTHTGGIIRRNRRETFYVLLHPMKCVARVQLAYDRTCHVLTTRWCSAHASVLRSALLTVVFSPTHCFDGQYVSRCCLMCLQPLKRWSSEATDKSLHALFFGCARIIHPALVYFLLLLLSRGALLRFASCTRCLKTALGASLSPLPRRTTSSVVLKHSLCLVSMSFSEVGDDVMMLALGLKDGDDRGCLDDVQPQKKKCVLGTLVSR